MRACPEGRVFADRISALASAIGEHVEAFQCRKCSGWHLRGKRVKR